MQKEMNGMMEKLTIAENDKRSAQQASGITWSLHLRVCVRVHAGIKYAYVHLLSTNIWKITERVTRIAEKIVIYIQLRL